MNLYSNQKSKEVNTKEKHYGVFDGNKSNMESIYSMENQNHNVNIQQFFSGNKGTFYNSGNNNNNINSWRYK